MPKARISASHGIYQAFRKILRFKRFGWRMPVGQLPQINATNDQFI
jgi:hypothetical protein